MLSNNYRLSVQTGSVYYVDVFLENTQVQTHQSINKKLKLTNYLGNHV